MPENMIFNLQHRQDWTAKQPRAASEQAKEE